MNIIFKWIGGATWILVIDNIKILNPGESINLNRV